MAAPIATAELGKATDFDVVVFPFFKASSEFSMSRKTCVSDFSGLSVNTFLN